MNYLDDFKKLLSIKRYSYSTIKSYSNALKNFLDAFPGSEPSQINVTQIENFINSMVVDKNISQAYQKVLVAAIKMFYNEMLRKNYNLNYLFPDRTEKTLPITVCSYPKVAISKHFTVNQAETLIEAQSLI